MATWKVGGYVIRRYLTDHGNHVHVFKDGKLIARYDLDVCGFMDSPARHRGRILAALRQVGLVPRRLG